MAPTRQEDRKGMFFSAFLRRQSLHTISAFGYFSVVSIGAILYPEPYMYIHIDRVTVFWGDNILVK